MWSSLLDSTRKPELDSSQPLLEPHVDNNSNPVFRIGKNFEVNLCMITMHHLGQFFGTLPREVLESWTTVFQKTVMLPCTGLTLVKIVDAAPGGGVLPIGVVTESEHAESEELSGMMFQHLQVFSCTILAVSQLMQEHH
jgi:hypothetical protein